MAGAGYNIPISLSDAQSLALPTAITSPYIVTYGSGNLVGGTGGSSANPILPSTAVATAANGPAESSASGTGVATAPASSLFGDSPNLLIYITLGVGAISLLGTAYLILKHK